MLRCVVALAVGLGVVVGACAEPSGDVGSIATSTSSTISPVTTATSSTATTWSTTATSSTTTTVVFGDSSLVVVPDESGGVPLELEVGCPGGPTFPVSAISSVEPLVGSGRDQIEAAIAGFLGSDEGAFWPQAEEWQVLHETNDEVLLVFVDPSVPTIGFQTIRLVDGAWKWADALLGGPCPLEAQLPRGLNRVTWRTDPDYGLDPASTTINLLAMERECASGQEMGDRLRAPNAVITSTEVRITLLADPPPGNYQTCPGNPEQPVAFELGMSLGDREVVDGLTVLGDLLDLITPVR